MFSGEGDGGVCTLGVLVFCASLKLYMHTHI